MIAILGKRLRVLATGKKHPNIWRKNRDISGIIQGYFRDSSGIFER